MAGSLTHGEWKTQSRDEDGDAAKVCSSYRSRWPRVFVQHKYSGSYKTVHDGPLKKHNGIYSTLFTQSKRAKVLDGKTM